MNEARKKEKKRSKSTFQDEFHSTHWKLTDNSRQMVIAEEHLYDRIHQRCSTKSLLDYLETHNGELTINMENFIEQLNIVESNNSFYAKTVVKTFVDHIENENDTVLKVTPYNGLYLSEWLYEKYVELLNVPIPPPTAKDVIQYKINDKIKIKIEETPYIISASGTTGFRTWEAALYLSRRLVDDLRMIPDNCTILEIGAGTGMVSLALSKAYPNKIKKLYVTDGDTHLLETQLQRNFQLNNVCTGKCDIEFEKLRWNVDAVPNDIGLMVAADVTYDSSVIPDLCQCIKQCLTVPSCSRCIISATIRNEDTIRVFEEQLQRLGLQYTIISDTQFDDDAKRCIEQELLLKPSIAPIKIYSISHR